MIEILQPASSEEWLELRRPTIGASEITAVLGVNPYMTPFEAWARKSELVLQADTKQMRRGNWFQPIVVEMIREERPAWTVRHNTIPRGEPNHDNDGAFYRDLESGLSCTPDAFVDKGDFSGLGICQIKTVNPHTFRDEWVRDGAIQVPPYVAIQAIQEAYLTGASWACVAVLVGFDLDLHILDVDIHPGIIARIKRAAPDFLRRVRENDPPPPDYARDGRVIMDLYAEDDGGTIDLSGNERVAKLVARHLALKEIESAAYSAEKEREIIDPQIIEAMGNAQRGTINGLLIEAKTVWRNYKARDAYRTASRPVKIKQRIEVA